MTKSILTPEELSDRWDRNISVKTLANWRCADPPRGPRFRRLGNRVLYPLDAVLAYETAREVGTATDPPSAGASRHNHVAAPATSAISRGEATPTTLTEVLASFALEEQNLRRRKHLAMKEHKRLQAVGLLAQLDLEAAQAAPATSKPDLPAKKQRGRQAPSRSYQQRRRARRSRGDHNAAD